MYKNTIFSQILKLLDRDLVKKAVSSHKSDKYCKSFSSWSHLVTMLFAQFNDSRSLRDVVVRFNSHQETHYHLRTQAVKKSTLSDANRNRDSNVFADIALGLINSGNKEIKDLVSLIDSSIIRVDGRGSDWTEATRTRCGKGLKLHIEMTQSAETIRSMSITGTNVNDITEARKIGLCKGQTYVFDKGYANYNWWHEINEAGGYFVTRLKHNAAFKVIKELSIADCSDKILSDKIIILTNRNPGGKRRNLLVGKELRLVEIYDEEHDKRYSFISNIFDKSADEISIYYKQRWGIELLFKWLKQNLKLTKFLGESENAIKIQLYVAIIAYILIGLFKKLCSLGFERSIDLLSWIKVTIFSTKTFVPPGGLKINQQSSQLALKGIL